MATLLMTDYNKAEEGARRRLEEEVGDRELSVDVMRCADQPEHFPPMRATVRVFIGTDGTTSAYPYCITIQVPVLYCIHQEKWRALGLRFFQTS
jgi:hypothetical protein